MEHDLIKHIAEAREAHCRTDDDRHKECDLKYLPVSLRSNGECHPVDMPYLLFLLLVVLWRSRISMELVF